MVERPGSHAQRRGGSGLHFPGADPEHFHAANIVIETQRHPGGEVGGAGKFSEIGADLSKQCSGNAAANARDLGKIAAEDAFEVCAQDAVGGCSFLGRRWGTPNRHVCRHIRGIEILQTQLDLAVTLLQQLLIAAVGGQRVPERELRSARSSPTDDLAITS
jgi:hypothetical protein